ncbi:50S ribosomal protein L6 [Candidatus Roizmanbacteria bacterium RIFCSPLOWO2_12_FULL_40_12]|uniref:50S ribosomal protein L6 n=1 Tax=Candidatus Roizmanbacteria bacterium RIFCSPLOWO2_01_FULL_40_42 TaxID=1802066 RepID=A0A1F7J4I7_9BACT|nr:MAG: 50S ribosomal protein L6 [Candidatus Roizmanbacteria bacterium RIFCSPHIGHO2_01_FULL_40_98]OGK27285.1 MAG: 50S ribosomal protein L6 [Candidatus Roizmanbacteria bacterium RIFCSPHIGHO2_02_FULL_40_53]OGK30843.1 MAG: 50S ribosomal protein L6 [Candidatus Roizmanbacteria bacterium RIFCSPHIGHO2_12_41_18]OGK36390.1 MAG: 50S ribosomal protein L6 [Candidatus Roizmanbacteria bacterium RIFCSPHIGHO2_12_FULL_40_130]OGK50518.1 MAG: 50S ribosomal protein L6 [Candidatus Roizmanbacteria bacterium RIFCSPLO
MSKIGEKPIIITEGVNVAMVGAAVSVKGKEGELSIDIPRELEVKLEKEQVNVRRKNEVKKVKALHGLYRTLISNAMQGVVTPWQKRLEIVGTGYNAKMQGEDLALKVGYSHPIVFKKVTGIKFQVDGNNIIIISGVDKQLVGQVAHQIKTNKKPDPYKGKGIRYEGERLKLKPGKKAKTAGAA